jgi:hypothetical protein
VFQAEVVVRSAQWRAFQVRSRGKNMVLAHLLSPICTS